MDRKKMNANRNKKAKKNTKVDGTIIKKREVNNENRTDKNRIDENRIDENISDMSITMLNEETMKTR